MKKLFSLMAMAMLILTVMPFVLGVDVGTGVGINIETEEFEPRLWMCDHREVIDDEVEDGRVDGRPIYAQKIETCEVTLEGCVTACQQEAESVCISEGNGPSECYIDQESLGCLTLCVEETIKVTGDPDLEDLGPEILEALEDVGLNGTIIEKIARDVVGRLSPCKILKGYELKERFENYAFEGEKIEWKVLVMDKNKIEQIKDVVATIGDVQGEMNDVEVECVELHGFSAPGERIKDECNARIDEEELDQFDPDTMAYYECTLTVETPESMYGEYWITVEANDGLNYVTMDENEYWFLNPVIALSVDGTIDFETVRPGTISYSDTILVGNDADAGSGVLLDMFVSGTDFYDPDSSGARCVITNRLKLGDNRVASGANYGGDVCRIGFGDTDDHLCYHATNGAYSTQGDPRSDAEGYAPIVYGDTFSEDFYNDAEIIWDGGGGLFGPYSPGNVLTPGAEVAMTFKLGLPEPCVGDFSDGDIFFWGEAI